MEIVEQGYEVVMKYMVEFWIESLKFEEEKNFIKSISFGCVFQVNIGGEGWLLVWVGGLLVNNWLGGFFGIKLVLYLKD